MSFFDPNSVPGYAEAVEAERTNRDLAFIGLPVPLCGVVVRQLTLRHLLLLEHCGNAFICGGIPEPSDVALFLWFLSPDYCLDPKKRDEFVRGVARLKMVESVLAIRAFLDGAFMDAPQNLDGGKAYFSTAAGLVSMLAREFGWDDEAILEKPVARLFQYQKAILHRYRPDLPLFNPSDALISRWLAKRNEEALRHV